MRRGWLPASAARLRVNRGFDSAWYSDVHYGELVQRDWTLTKNAWSLITRASRSKPQQKLTLAQQIEDFKTMRYSGIKAAKEIAEAQAAPKVGIQGEDYPNQRVARIFTQHLPYKSIVSTFAYSLPQSGEQKRYGLLPKTGAGRPF